MDGGWYVYFEFYQFVAIVYYKQTAPTIWVNTYTMCVWNDSVKKCVS